MKRPTSYFIVGLTLTAVLITACGSKKSKDGRTDTYSSGAISFASDESFSPLIEEEREVFEYTYPQASITPIYTSESDAVQALLRCDSIWLAITARDYKDEERQNLRDRTYNPQSFAIAYDALALIVNNENTDTCISVKNLRDILNGDATRWSDIYPGSTRGDIVVVFDNPKSSTVHYAEDSILGGKPIVNPNVVATENTADVITYVEQTPNAIGIIGSNWLNDKRDTTNLTFKKNIRTMAVTRLDEATPQNSWKPYQYYIYNGNYPLIRTIYALVTDPRRGLPWGFAHFIVSPQGQMIVLKAGLLPVQGNITVRNVHVTD